MPRRAQYLIAATCICGLAIAGISIAFPFHVGHSNPVEVFVFIFLGIVGGSKKVRLVGDKNYAEMCSISLGFTITFAALLRFGPELGMFVGCVTTFSSVLYPKRQPAHQLIFNVALAAVSAYVCGLVFLVANGWALVLTRTWTFPAVLAAGLAYFLCNTMGVASIIGVSTGRPILLLWKETFLWTIPTYFAGASAATLILLMFDKNLTAALLFGAPVLFQMYEHYTSHAERDHANRQHIAELQIQEKQLQAHQTKLQRQTDILNGVLDNLAQGVIVIDRKGQVILHNPAAERILGPKIANEKSCKWGELDSFYRSDGITKFDVNEIMQDLIEGSASVIETFFQPTDGRRGMWLRIFSRPLPSPDSSFDGTVLVLRDFTEEVLARKELEARARDLARSNIELSRSNADLAQFAYAASHDLQEPLRMVGSYLQLLSRRYKGKLDADADEFIHFAVDGASRMQALIKDLLAYSQVGTLSGEFQRIDASETLAMVLDDLQLAIRESGATITADPLPQVWADPTQLGQIFQNLLSNALKFRGEEPPRIRVTSEIKGGLCEFSVEDNGTGFDPQFAGKIFHLFQRLHPKSEFEGNGMGLAICKRIVERHGGKIWAESLPHGGSVFRFTIPAHRPHDDPESLYNINLEGKI